MVLQDMQLQVWYALDEKSKFKVLSCSIIHPDEASEDEEKHVPNSSVGPEGVRVCTAAAIGLAYNGACIVSLWHSRELNFILDSSIILATRSSLLPAAYSEPGLALHIPMDLSEPFSKAENAGTGDWGYWGNSLSIELAEARFGFEGSCHRQLLNVLGICLSGSPDIHRPPHHRLVHGPCRVPG
jgi:hypothetical protein